MKRTDYLLRGLIPSCNARVVLTETTATAEAGILTHNTDPVASHLFGRALTVAALTSPLLEGEEKYSLRWQYEGKIGTILCESDAHSHIRGLCSNSSLIDAESPEDLYGPAGLITVMKSENGAILNSGQAEAGLLDISGDIAFFFSTSDQIETEIKTVIGFTSSPESPVAISAGFMIQAMPECDLRQFDQIRKRMLKETFSDILSSTALSEEAKLKKIIRFITDGEDEFELFFADTPTFTCSCSRERMKAAVKLLKKEELDEVYKSNNKPEITCRFCKKTYSFSKDELAGTKDEPK